MTRKGAAIAFIRKHGVVLASAKGPVPRLSEFIAGRPIKGSWWGDAAGQEIFLALQEVEISPEVLRCRIVDGKVTYVHRRLWPALARVAKKFAPDRVAQITEEHTSSGRHITRQVAFPKWVPSSVLRQAKQLTEEEALSALGSWVLGAQPTVPADASLAELVRRG